MVQCDHCSDEVDYLPFTCRYCGKSYCKKHRIPENHECSFEFKNDPYKVRSREEPKPSKIYADYPAESQPRQDAPRRARVRMPRIRDRTNRTRPQTTSLLGMQAKPYGTYGIMIATIAVFAFSIILAYFDSDYLVYLSISDYVDGSYNYWTFITSIFTPINPIGGYSEGIRIIVGIDLFISLLYLFIKLFMLFFIGRMVEARWGWKTLVKIYIFSGLLASLGTLLIHFLFSLDVFSSFFPGLSEVQYQTSWGASMGLIAFIAMIFPQQQVTMYLYFIPVRVKMKNLLWIMIGMNAIFGLFRIFLTHNPYFVQDLGVIAGILGGLIFYRVMRNRNN